MVVYLTQVYIEARMKACELGGVAPPEQRHANINNCLSSDGEVNQLIFALPYLLFEGGNIHYIILYVCS